MAGTAGLLALLIVSIGLLYLGLRMLLSDISGYQAESFILDWQGRGTIGSETAWDVAHHAALRSIELSPVAHGVHFQRAGTIHEWRHGLTQPGSPQARESRRAALTAYRQEVRVKGAWPYAWLRLAQVKMNLLEFDTEFDHALRQSVIHGEWRPRVNFTVALLGMSHWHALSDTQRALILAAAARSIQQEPHKGRRLIEFAESMDLKDTLCQSMATWPTTAQINCRVTPPD